MLGLGGTGTGVKVLILEKKLLADHTYNKCN